MSAASGKQAEVAKSATKPADAPASKPAKADPTKVHMASAWKYARPLTACRFDPTGKFVFAGTEDYTVERFRLSDGAATPLVGHESWCRAIAFTPDGATTITGGYDGKLLWWPTAAEKPTPARSIVAHDGWVRGTAVRYDGKLLASCGNDRLVKLWNPADGKLLRTLAGHESHVYSVAFHPTAERLVSCDLKAVCKVWNLADGTCEREFTAQPIYKYDTQFRADIGGARSLAFGDGGKRIALGGITNVTNAFAGIGNAAWVDVDFASGKAERVHGGKEKINGAAWGAAWHPDGYWIGASGGQAGALYFFKPESETEFFAFKLPDTARDMDLSPDGLQLAVAHGDGNLRIYKLAAKA